MMSAIYETSLEVSTGTTFILPSDRQYLRRQIQWSSMKMFETQTASHR